MGRGASEGVYVPFVPPRLPRLSSPPTSTGVGGPRGKRMGVVSHRDLTWRRKVDESFITTGGGDKGTVVRRPNP